MNGPSVTSVSSLRTRTVVAVEVASSSFPSFMTPAVRASSPNAMYFSYAALRCSSENDSQLLSSP